MRSDGKARNRGDPRRARPPERQRGCTGSTSMPTFVLATVMMGLSINPLHGKPLESQGALTGDLHPFDVGDVAPGPSLDLPPHGQVSRGSHE